MQNISSITVVEVSGNPAQFKQQVDGGVATLAITKDGVSEYPTKLSLFKINDNTSYPFATRLLEYLFGQAITEDEQISDNIEMLSGFHIPGFELSEDENNWVNVAFSRYYGIKGIRMVKEMGQPK